MTQDSKQSSTASLPIAIKLIVIFYFLGALAFIVSIFFGARFFSMLFGNKAGNLMAGLIVVLVVFSLIAAGINVLIGWGIWKGKNWARIIAIVGSIFSVLDGLLRLGSLPVIGVIEICLGVAIGGYLIFSKNGKQFFQGGVQKKEDAKKIEASKKTKSTPVSVKIIGFCYVVGFMFLLVFSALMLIRSFSLNKNQFDLISPLGSFFSSILFVLSGLTCVVLSVLVRVLFRKITRILVIVSSMIGIFLGLMVISSPLISIPILIFNVAIGGFFLFSKSIKEVYQ